MHYKNISELPFLLQKRGAEVSFFCNHHRYLLGSFVGFVYIPGKDHFQAYCEKGYVDVSIDSGIHNERQSSIIVFDGLAYKWDWSVTYNSDPEVKLTPKLYYCLHGQMVTRPEWYKNYKRYMLKQCELKYALHKL